MGTAEAGAERDAHGEDPDETEHLGNEGTRMPELLNLDEKGFILLGPLPDEPLLVLGSCPSIHCN